MSKGTGHEDPPEEPRFAGGRIVLCPHLPPGIHMLSVVSISGDIVCALCVEDALAEAEGLLEE